MWTAESIAIDFIGSVSYKLAIRLRWTVCRCEDETIVQIWGSAGREAFAGSDFTEVVETQGKGSRERPKPGLPSVKHME